MVSFWRLQEAMDNKEPDDAQAMEAIRNGNNLRKGDCGDFWEDFISVCGNADAMASLLDIPKEKITGWPAKVRKMIEKVGVSDGQDDVQKNKRTNILHTGNIGDL